MDGTSSERARTRDDALVHEAIRVYRRYAVEIVERFEFCPYAKHSRVQGKTRELVSLDPTLDVERVLPLVHAIADERELEIGLLLFPNVSTPRLELARFVERLRHAHQAEPTGLVMAMEAFHPDADADLESPERHVPFVRRTPDPTIQLVRHDVLLDIRREGDHGTGFFDPATMSLDALFAKPDRVPLHEVIARANLKTTCAHGVLAIERIYADIRRDRDESYARVRAEAEAVPSK